MKEFIPSIIVLSLFALIWWSPETFAQLIGGGMIGFLIGYVNGAVKSS